MKQYFFLGAIIVFVVGGIAYYLWSVAAALYHDWSLARGVDKLKAESDERRARRREQDERRLENGCEHAFGETFGGFPLNACHKCGLERERPRGECDHAWRFANEATPCSYCEKCGKKYVAPRAVS
jgi:hypothetical protein